MNALASTSSLAPSLPMPQIVRLPLTGPALTAAPWDAEAAGAPDAPGWVDPPPLPPLPPFEPQAPTAMAKAASRAADRRGIAISRAPQVHPVPVAPALSLSR